MKEDHTLIRATLVPSVVGLIARYYGISEESAMAKFYASNTALAFADDDIGLYGASALNVAGRFIEEKDGVIDLSRLR